MVSMEERAAIEKEIKAKFLTEQRAYKAAWRKKNKDKIRASNARYYQKKKASKSPKNAL